jgi:hypothetical protein
MPEMLQDAGVRISDDFPYAIDLELRVEDRDVIAALVNFPAGPAREEYALEALKIGVLALRRASTALDGEFIQRETTRLLESLRRSLDDHARSAHERMTLSLKEYFDPQDGRFSQRVQCLTAADGDLARLLGGLLDGDDSRLAKTLLAHLGENSPLLKWLSPDQSQGLLAALRTNVETQLSLQRERLLKEFTLDNADGALCRLVKELTSKHGDLSKDLQGKIDVLIKEFSFDEEDSALNRLVKNVDRAQRTITNEFSLDNEQSALQRLKKELLTILSAHLEANEKFQQGVTETLAKLIAKREAEQRSTTHGATFQNAVYAFIDQCAQRRGDLAEDVSDRTGLVKNCKVGDAVIQLGPDSAAAGARIVIEAKEESRFSLCKAHEEIEQARKNRDAQQGVFVFSQRTAPAMEPLIRTGADVFVVWDAEDPQTDAYLSAALEISRALCFRTHTAAERQRIDFGPIDRAVLDIEKCVQNFDQVRTWTDTIKSNSEKILERIRKDREGLEKQLGVLREAMNGVKQVLTDGDSG